MKGRRAWAASFAIAAMAAQPAFADDFWSSFTKDVQGFTGAIRDGIQDVIDTKKDVGETVEDARRLEEEISGPADDEPRYDSAWVAELQQRLTAQGYDPGPIDGAFGNRTSKAIAAFQQHAGMAVNGLPQPSLMRALRARTQGIQTAQTQPERREAPLQTAGTPPALPSTGVWRGGPAPGAEPAYPDFVRLALRAGSAAYAAQREVAGVAYRLAIADGPTCAALVNRFAGMRGDVFVARDFVLESAALLDQALADLDAIPAALEVSLSDRVHFQPYDFAAGGYPLSATPLLRGGRRSLTDRTSAPPCDAGLSLHHALPKQSMTVSRVGLGSLSVELEGAPGAQVLPMAESDARAFDARNTTRMIDLVAHVRMEPPEEAFGALRGRLLALEARDPASGETIYRFPVVPAVAEAADPSAPGYQPEYADFVHLALMSDLEAYLADAETTGLAVIAATGDERECRRMYDVVRSRDEFALREIRAEAASRLRDVAGGLDLRPRRLEIEIEAPYRLDEYDFDREGFPFARQYQKPAQPILEPGIVALPGDERPVPCQGLNFDIAPPGAAATKPKFVGLGAEHQGVPGVTFLPMPVEQARNFRAAGKQTVVLRAELVVEARAHGRGPLAGRIAALSAHDPETGELLHRFDVRPSAPPAAQADDGPVRWTTGLAAALLAPVVEPTMADAALDSAAVSYFRRHKIAIDQGNPPPGSPLPMEELRGQQPEVIVAFNRDRLRAALRGNPLETPVTVAFEEELMAEFREDRGLILPSFEGHKWLISAAPDAADPLRSAKLSSRALPLYPKTWFSGSYDDDATFRTATVSSLHLGPALELDRILHLEPIAASIELVANRGFRPGFGPRVEPVIVRWELDVLGARMDGDTPVISARLSDLSFRWSSDDAPLATVDVAALPTVAALRAPEIAARAQSEAEEAERERRAAEAAQARLDAILQGRTGLLLIRRADVDEVNQVLVESESVAQEYRRLVLVNNLGLPAKARVLSPLGPMTSNFLRQAPGAAVFVDSEVFAQELFVHVADLDLEAVPLLADGQETHEEPTASAPSPATAVSLQSLAPGDAPLLLVRRREDAPIERAFEQDGVNYSSQMREATFGTRYLGDGELVLDLPKRAQTIELDEAPDLLRMASGAAVVLQREGLATILPRISDLDLVAIRFPIEEYQFGIPKDHTKGAHAFAILGITGGMGKAAALEGLNGAFAPDEIVHDPAGDAIRLSRGACEPARATGPGEAAEIGAYCLWVGLADGAVARVMLRQVVEGDAAEIALAAFAERYGRSQRFREVRHLERGGRRIVVGWGEALDAGRDELSRVAAKSPPAVLEAVVWVVDGVTTVLLHLDTVPTVAEVEAAQAPEIKF
jgi:hypothetical protein